MFCDQMGPTWGWFGIVCSLLIAQFSTFALMPAPDSLDTSERTEKLLLDHLDGLPSQQLAILSG